LARSCSTICLPIGKDDYQDLIDPPARFRAWLDQAFRHCPERFPKAFAQGYRLKDDRISSKTGLRFRRIRCLSTGQSFSVRASFALPYLTGTSDDVQGPLFLRAFGVPFWAIARVFGRDHSYWYRLEVSLGRNSIAGSTVRRVELPEQLLADEHHQPRDGQKNYSATTVGAGGCPGAALAQSAGSEDLQAADEVFTQEAQNVQAGYQPQTVSVDGWAATRQSWLALFPLVVLLRSRGKLSETFATLSENVWNAYRALNRRSFAQRLRRLWEWAQGQKLTAWLLEEVEKMCSRSSEYCEAYRHRGGQRTSNMLDRLMRSMNRYFEEAQHLHGSKESRERHCRAWALLHNFRPWHPATERANGGWRSPAERLNKHRYHEDWLQNLLVSASLGGYRR
jgi:hypothetical protein